MKFSANFEIDSFNRANFFVNREFVGIRGAGFEIVSPLVEIVPSGFDRTHKSHRYYSQSSSNVRISYSRP